MLLEEFRSAASFFEQDGLCFFFFFFLKRGQKPPKKIRKKITLVIRGLVTPVMSAYNNDDSTLPPCGCRDPCGLANRMSAYTYLSSKC